MTSLLIKTAELPNPFAEMDVSRDKLEALEQLVYKQEQTIEMLVHSVGLLMRAENLRLDRRIKHDKENSLKQE